MFRKSNISAKKRFTTMEQHLCGAAETGGPESKKREREGLGG